MAVGRGWQQRGLVAWEKKGGSDGQVGVQVGRAARASGLEARKQKKEKERAIALGLGLGQQMEVESGPSWAGIGPRLKEMGL